MRLIDDILETLSECPPGDHAQIDDTITPRIKELIGKPAIEIASAMKTILDECAFGGLASDFGMLVMDQTWRMALKEAEEELQKKG